MDSGYYPFFGSGGLLGSAEKLPMALKSRVILGNAYLSYMVSGIELA